MLRYTQRDVISIKHKHSHEDIGHHDDMVYDVLNHLDYIEERDLDIEYIGQDTSMKECDYCGKLLHRRMCGGNTRIYTNTYIDKESEYPCTDDSCMECSGEKKKMIFFEKHGVTYNLTALETKAKNGKVPSSRPQIYLSKLLNGEHNKYIKNIGYLDIVITRDKLVVEYDGSGHFAGIYFGNYTYEEKILQDYQRDLKAKELGYRIIRIDSKEDFLPSDEAILRKIKEVKNHFNKSGKDFYKWEIPKNQKDKNFGRLRKINEEDISWHRKSEKTILK